MRTKFIHVTDPHLAPSGQTLCTLDPAARLRMVVEDVNRLHGDADALFLTGDVAYKGLEAGYKLAHEILSELRIPYHLLIGNHDDRTAFKRTFPETPLDDAGFVQYVIDHAVGSLIVLDTVRHGEEDGEMCPARLTWLATQLEERRGKPVFIFMHHPPFDVGIASLDASKLPQSRELSACLTGHGQIRHIFYGHVHRAIAGSWHGIPATAMPSTNHQVGLLLDASPEMIGTHERPAYGVIIIDDETVVIHQRDFLDDSPRFVLMDEQSMRARSIDELVVLPPDLVGRA